MANVSPQSLRFNLGVALMTQRPSVVLNKTQIGQFNMARFAPEARRVPVEVHRFDDTPNDELAAFSAARREEHLEIMLAVFTILEFVEGAIFEDLKALRAHETILMPQFPRGIDDFLVGLETVAAAGAEHVIHGHRSGNTLKIYILLIIVSK